MEVAGWIHLKKIVNVKLLSTREVLEGGEVHHEARIGVYVKSSLVSDRWYRVKDNQDITIDLKVEV